MKVNSKCWTEFFFVASILDGGEQPLLIMDNYSQDEIMTIFGGYLKIESKILHVEDSSKEEKQDPNELQFKLENVGK